MSKSPVIQSFKRHPWLLLLLLAALQTAGVLFFLNRRSEMPLATSTAPSPLPTASIVPMLSSPAAAPGKTATKSARKSAPPAAPAKAPAKPALTAEQQALNEKYKATLSSSGSAIDSLIEMRVAIAEGVPSVTIGSSTATTLLDQDRKSLMPLAAGTRYTAQPSGDGITLEAASLPKVVILEPSADGLIYLGDRTYRGRLLLVNDGGKLWAVNLVNLKNYLHSVVASEVSPNWSPEALKAQAVAARSYALTYYFKPMSALFHLGATEYYQVYSGIDREASATSQAVDATAGQFVSYRGGIVESLYAASDDIVAEAFQGRGMSQLGALNLAEQGYSYQQILANYYPGTGLGQIVQDYE